MYIITIILIILIIYGHVGYPLLLNLFFRLKERRLNTSPSNRSGISDCPHVHMIIPAFNEEAVIQQKISSLNWLDYPENKLSITIYCDGCKDNTVQRAVAGLKEFYNKDLDIRIVVIKENVGKIAVLNKAIVDCDRNNQVDLIVFSDASSILSSDALWRSVQHFIESPEVSVVTGDYSLLNSGNDGERNYWRYQNKVRYFESTLGSVMGVTGAYYMIRKTCIDLIEPDTINDDFIVPMKTVAKGGVIKFDRNINIYETEATPIEQDAQRRYRISQGNMQQILRLKSLLIPSFNRNDIIKGCMISWMFISGKVLRTLMPYLLISFLATSIYLSFESPLFFMLLVGQLAVYILSVIYWLNKSHQYFNHKIVRLIAYLCQSHLMALMGSASYLLDILRDKIFGSHTNRRWHKVVINTESSGANYKENEGKKD